MTFIPSRPTPEQLADAFRDRIAEPAVNDLEGQDGRLSRREAGRSGELTGLPRLIGSQLDRYFEVTGYRSSSGNRVIAAAHDRVLALAQGAVSDAGTIDSETDLPVELRPIFRALGGGAEARPIEGYGWSERVLNRIMARYGIEDRDALLAEAIRHDTDGNRYLKTSELEAAAKVLTGEAQDLGIISDLDRTIIPNSRDTLPDAPIPGIVQLLNELEDVDGDRGDTTFVTARNRERIENPDVRGWLEEHGVPDGPIETGHPTDHWRAEGEKVADISRVLDANPGKRYVLFGDSNHRDPEVYRTIRERYPDRITAAFIRRTNNVNPARVEGLHLIENYAEAASILLDLGVIDQAAARRVMVAAQLEGLDITDAEIEGLLGER